MTRGFGASLRVVIGKGTKNRFSSFVAGIGVTALLQSATATILIVATFAGQGMVTTAAALAVILGADVGTTLVAQVLTFDLSWLAPLLMVVGYVFFKREKSSKLKNIGRILIGLALMLFALGWIRASALPLKESETLPLILQPLQNDVILALMVSAAITWVVHSSLAFVLLVTSLVGSGVLPLPLGLVMVLGANLGGTIPPIIATMKDSPPAFRIAIGNLFMRLVGVAVAAPLVAHVQPWIADLNPDPARQIVNFHMVFNVGLALLFLPLVGVVARVCVKAAPDKQDPDDPAQPKYLDHKAYDSPAIALASAKRETLRMADLVERMLADSLRTFKTNDENVIRQVREQDDVIDKLYLAIKSYMARVTEEFMDKDEAAQYIQILTFATNLEHSGDVIDKNLMPLALKKIRNQHSFSGQGFREIERIHGLVLDSVRLAQSVFMSGDVDLARRLIEEKEKIRQAEIAASVAHIERLREGIPETFATSSLHMDIIRDLRRINTYMCTVAYPLLESAGEVRATRLLPRKGPGSASGGA